MLFRTEEEERMLFINDPLGLGEAKAGNPNSDDVVCLYRCLITLPPTHLVLIRDAKAEERRSATRITITRRR